MNTVSISEKYLLVRAAVEQRIQEWLPLVNRLDRFECFVLLNIVLFVLCWIVAKFSQLNLRQQLSPSNIKARLFAFAVKHVWFVRNQFQKEIDKLGPSIYGSIPEEYRSKIHKIPNRKPNDTSFKDESEGLSLRGYLSGSRYALKNHSDLVSDLSSRFIYSNPLHFNIYPCVRQMEIEVIKMTSKMLNFSDHGQPVGAFMNGGTESILMAILAYREYGRSKGITKPNLLICYTGHVASIKACKYFDIDIKFIEYDSEFRMCVSDTKRNIDENTIGVYTSCPSYPYGTIDPVKEIAAYCKPRDIPVHIDMCLGGFLIPFLKNEKGEPIFTIPDGVTTISLDPHKFGLAGKGASVLLYSSAKMRCYQFFSTSYWPGGLYGTVGISGSRSGSGISSAWISMMRSGLNGYQESAEQVQSAVRKFKKALLSMGFKFYGNADVCTIAFAHSKYPCNSLQTVLKRRNWGIALLQKPITMHFSFTPLNSTKVDQLIKDIRESLTQLDKSKQSYKETTDTQLYGACAKLPDDSSKDQLFREILSCYIDI